MPSNQPFEQAVRRQSWIDLCRVCAIGGVVLIHACGATFYQYNQVPLQVWLVANFLDSLARCAVPLFVMVSGALLLKDDASDYSFRQIVHRLARVAIPLLSWSVFYLFYVSHFTGEPIQLLSIFRQAAMYHLWFVYMIMGIYILLPVLSAVFRVIVRDSRLQLYLLALWFLITSLPVYVPFPILDLLQQTSFFGYGGYFLIGGVVANQQYLIPLRFWWCTYLAGVVATFGLTHFFSQQQGAAVETAYGYFSPNVFISSVAAFGIFCSAKVPLRLEGALRWISDRSFLIFFVHVIVLEHVSRATSGLPVWISIPLSAVGTFVFSLVIAAAIRLLPAAKRVVG